MRSLGLQVTLLSLFLIVLIPENVSGHFIGRGFSRDSRTLVEDQRLSSVTEEEKLRVNSTTTSSGCVEAGSMFAEGSAMASSDNCSFCYCIRGERRCVTPKCKLPLRGCKPRYRSVSCCPSYYDCPKPDYPASTTTAATTTVTTKGPSSGPGGVGCIIKGRQFFEGQFIPGVGGSCNVCYCLRGRVQCSEVQCKPPVLGCKPIQRDGQCCPIRYDCEDAAAKKNSRPNPSENLIKSRGISQSKLNIDDISISFLSSAELDEVALANHVRVKRNATENQATEPEIQSTQIPLEYAEVETTSLPETPIETENLVLSTEISESPTIEDHNTEPLPEENDKASSLDPTKVKMEPKVTENVESVVTSTHAPEVEISEQNDSKLKEELENKESDSSNTNTLFLEEEILHKKTLLSENEDRNSIPNEKKPAVVEEVENTTYVPFMSISDLLKKIKESSTKNKDSLEKVLPGPINSAKNNNLDVTDSIDKENETVTDVKETNLTPEPQPAEEPEQPVEEEEVEFPSYDINVGTSIIAGKQPNEPIGVGHVIPVDLHDREIIPAKDPSTPPTTASPTTKPTKSEPSFLDTFLNLLAGNTASSRHKLKTSNRLRPTPPPLKQMPPPLLGMKAPPPLRDNVPTPISEKNDEVSDVGPNDAIGVGSVTEVQTDLHESPAVHTFSRHDFPIRQRPDAIPPPLRPGFVNLRPDFALPKPINSKLDFTLPVKTQLNFGGERSPVGVVFPANPNLLITKEKSPILPPSLPNLQIIPFVASDAIVNKDEEENQKSPSTAQPIGNCREGGKTWKNGQTVAKGDNDPCILCRCHFGKVVCQHLECPEVPEGCSVQLANDLECCPQITCDNTANVSIIDTLPKFRPIQEENDDELSKPVQPSDFAHHNRRPPFAPASRRPNKPALPLSELRKSFISLHSKSESETEPEKIDEVSKPRPILPQRPSRPIIPRPSIPKFKVPPPSRVNKVPPRPFAFAKPGKERPHPFSNVRTGTRRPFIPPRLRKVTKRIFSQAPTTPLPTAKPTTTTVAATTTTSTTTSTTTTEKPVISDIDSGIPVSSSVTFIDDNISLPPSPPKRTRPFLNLFELLSKNKQAGSNPFKKETKPKVEVREKTTKEPFRIPPDLLLPRPIKPSRLPIEDNDIINLVEQDKLKDPQNEPLPEVVFNINTPNSIVRPFKPTAKPLPEIPEVVKAQLPLGNDPILVSGLLELGGCNVYGRMFEIGERIEDISGKCKACQCTKVGVQCLPIC